MRVRRVIFAIVGIALLVTIITPVAVSADTIDKIIVPGLPPEKRISEEPVSSFEIKQADAVLSDVPAFDWCYGCSATSAAMMFGYYDRTGYSNMYAGPTNGGVCPLDNSDWGPGECSLSATHQGCDGLAVKGHVDDYWSTFGSTVDPYYGNWAEHGYADCTADFMGTNQYVNWQNSDGTTTFYFYDSGAPLYDYTGCEPDNRDGCHGIRLFVESRGYIVIQNYNQRIDENVTGGFTYANFKAEIDAGRPVIIQVTNHSMLGYGYDDPDTIYIHDTWDHSDHSMTWGGTYSGLEHYGVTVIEMLYTCGNMNVNPTSWSPTLNCGESDNEIVTVSATGGTVEGVTVSKISGPTWLSVSPTNLGDIASGSSKTFTMTAAPPAGTSGDFTYTVRGSNTCGTPSTRDVTGTIHVDCPESSWTYMVYLDGDNNLEGAGIDDFLEMSSVGSTSDVNIVVQFDRIPGYSSAYDDWTTCKRFLVTQGMTPTPVNALMDLGECNMGDPNTLRAFVEWAMAEYPADNYALILWNHGSGYKKRVPWADETGIDRGICYDDTDGDHLTLQETEQALAGKHVEVLGYDACLMHMIEVVYQVRTHAAISVGSEEYEPGDGWPYNTILGDLTGTPTMTPSTLGDKIVSRYIASYAPAGEETQSAVDKAKVSNLASAVDTLAQVLIDKLPDDYAKIQQARNGVEEFVDPDFIDLYHFAELIKLYLSDNPAAVAAAQAVMDNVDNTVTAEGHGTAHPNAHGLSIYFPKDCKDYLSSYEGTKFAIDTQWDEFLIKYCGGLDLIFTIDTTGSMWDDIDNVKAAATDIVNAIDASIPNYRIAVVDYRDFPVSPYGGSGDYPFHDQLAFSTDKPTIVAGIQGLTLGWGGDIEESVYSGLMHSIDATSLGGWRGDDYAMKAIILMGDAPPHDPEPFTGYTLSSVITAAELADPVICYPIQIGGEVETFEEIASGTGGEVFTAEDADDVVDAILEAIETIATKPVADPNGPYTGTKGVPITFDGSGSYDPDGTIVSYDWDFDDGGTGTGKNPTHTYAEAKIYTVTLTVTDNDALTDTKTTTATIADTGETLVSIEDASAPQGGTVTVPIKIADVANMCGANIWLNYNKDIVIVDSVSDGDLVPLTHSIDNTAGVTKMTWDTTSGMTGNFVFAYVTLKAVGNSGDTCLLDLDLKELYDCDLVEIPRTVADGTFEVIAPLMEGDVTDLNVCVSLKDSTLIKFYLVDMATLTPDQLECAETNDDGEVTLKDSTAIKFWLVDHYPLWESPADDHMMEPVPCSVVSLARNATSTTVFSIEDTSVPQGETVTVPIKIADVANMCGANIWLNYEKDVVIVDSVSDGDLVPLTHSIDNTAGVTKMTWDTTSGMTGDFVFAYVTLKAVGNSGDTCLLDIDVKELYDCVPPFNEIPRAVADGTFTVRADIVPKPDLIITAKWLCWPDNCTICYNVTNTGDGTAPSGHNTALYVDDVEVAHDHVPVDLAPGESYTGCFNGYVWTYTPPSDDITVCADNSETIDELDEDNNCMTNIWMCGDVNGDRAVNVIDVVLIYKRALDPGYPLDLPWAGDVNCDRNINVIDVVLVYKRALDPGYDLNCCCEGVG